MSGPSEKAIEAARVVAHEGPMNLCDQLSDTCDTVGPLMDLLRAAHDPALGLDRSVCLRDVVEFLLKRPGLAGARVEREFGGGAAERCLRTPVDGPLVDGPGSG